MGIRGTSDVVEGRSSSNPTSLMAWDIPIVQKMKLPMQPQHPQFQPVLTARANTKSNTALSVSTLPTR